MSNATYPAFENYNPRQAALAQARDLLTQAAQAAMEAGDLPAAELPAFIVEVPADTKNGDIASNIAMAGARTWHKAPKMIAEAILSHLPSLSDSCFTKAETAGPGFINLFLAPAFWAGVALAACSNPRYGRTDYGQGKRYNVEFVSANPTGPMHMGNARGGALGDCLSAVLEWAGYDVTREFYINDAGNQIQKFGKSLAIRYLQHYYEENEYPLPKECYQGGDITLLALEFAAKEGDKYAVPCRGLKDEALYESEAFAALKDALVGYALPKNIQGLHDDLARYRVEYDNWFKESTLHENGAVGRVVELLKEKGATYEKDGATWFHGEAYGSEDFVLVRSNGVPTYVVPDIAYHYDKLVTRGFDLAIDVLGADHHGYVPRLKGALSALGVDADKLQVVLMQMVRLVRDGEIVKASKRSGKAITLVTLLDEVPVDAARFLFNSYEANTRIDFDLDLAVQQDSQNPVYYVQYAHARICSLLSRLGEEGEKVPAAQDVDASLMTTPEELALMKALAQFPEEIHLAARDYDPSRINRYLVSLAGDFHRFYNSCRIKGEEPAVLSARLKLADTVRAVLSNGMGLLGVSAPEKM